MKNSPLLLKYLGRRYMVDASKRLRQYVKRLQFAVTLSAALVISSCSSPESWKLIDIHTSLPELRFSMTRVDGDEPVTAEDFRGKVVILEFGYTFCPDICPTTLSNLTSVMSGLNGLDKEIVILFVTVDPDRDKSEVLKEYVESFSSNTIGLRGTPDQLAALARRYRVAYSVDRSEKSGAYEVMHTATLFFFDRKGRARLLSPGSDNTDDIAHDLRMLLDEGAS